MTNKIPNYLKKIMIDFQSHPEHYQGGTVSPTHIYHDDWCEFWKGLPCNCNPHIVIDPPIKNEKLLH